MGDPFSFSANSEIFEEDFTEQIVNVNWPGGATEFNSGAFQIAPSAGPVSSLGSTISMFIYIPSDGWDAGHFKDMLEFGPKVGALGNFTTSSITFQSDGAGKASISAALNSAVVHDTSEDAFAEYYFTQGGAITQNPSGGSGGVATFGSWHHVYIGNNLQDVLTLDDPDTIDDIGDRVQDVFFVARSEIYVDRVSVGFTSSGNTPRALTVPPGYAEISVSNFFLGLDPTTLVQTLPAFTGTYIVDPDRPTFSQTISAGFAGPDFSGALGVPNLTGVDLEGPGNPPTVVRFAAVQIWPNQYIPPSNLDKFVKLDKNGAPQMVDPKVAAAAFGAPTFSYNGPPKQFTKTANISGSIGSTIKQVKAPPKAQ